MVAILYRFAQYKGADVSVGGDTNILSFSDAAAVSEYAVPAMQWACGSGLVAGVAQEGRAGPGPQGHHHPRPGGDPDDALSEHLCQKYLIDPRTG